MYWQEPGLDDAKSLLDQAKTDGLDELELIRRLMLMCDLSRNWHQRSARDGAPRLQEFELTPFGMRIVTRDAIEITYESASNGMRWRLAGDLVSRSEVEKSLGAWPGYLDGIEDAYRPMRTIYLQLDRERQRLEQSLETERGKLKNEFVNTVLRFERQIEARSANERHPQLRRWREANPCASATIPEQLRTVRHIKRAEIAEPAYVYFLLRDGKVVYVGQTSAAWPARVLQHLKENTKKFDDVWYLEVDRPSLTHVERRYIQEFLPEYNRSQGDGPALLVRPARQD